MGARNSYGPSVLAAAAFTLLLGAAPAPIVQPAAGGAPWPASAIATLDADLDALTGASPALRGAHYGIYAIDTVTGNVLYSHAADDDFQPASTFKLVVGSTALDRLTPSFTWTTTAAVAKILAPNGDPDLVFTPSGDPTLTTSDVEDAVAKLPASNVRSALIDDSAFDDVPYANGWTWDDFGEDYAPSVSAATLDENVIETRVTPGRMVGDPASVEFAPGRVASVGFHPCDAYTDAYVGVLPGVRTGTANSEDTVDATQTAGRCPEVVGSIPLGAAPETIAVSMYRPIAYMHEVLRRSLAARKISVETFHHITGGSDVDSIRLTAAPAEAPARPYWTHASKPLGELLGPRFWIPSDNLFGELLLKQLGSIASGKPGTTGKGVADEKAWLASLGVDTSTVTLADGCGMSQYDRITPHDLVTILQHDWNGPNRQLVLDSLPVGGSRGTIEGIAGTPAAGRTFAKTGSMMHVRGLAGYLATQRHGAVTFAFEVDDWNGDYASLAALRARLLSRIVADPS